MHNELMTKTLQVRAVPDDVHRELASRAAAAGMPLSEYVLRELIRVASRPRIADVLARADARVSGVSAEEIVAAVRQARDDR